MGADRDFYTEPTLTDLLNAFRENLFGNLRVAMPGTVVVYDAANQLVDVQPLVMERDVSGGTPLPYPVLGSVPLVQPRSAGAAITLPLIPGDAVTLLFSDRDLSGWKASNGTIPTEPPSTRKHDLSDCWAIPGGFPGLNPKPPGLYPLALEIQLLAGTKIAIHDGAGNELLTILNDLITAILAMTLTETGATTVAPPLNAATFTALQTQLALFKTP